MEDYVPTTRRRFARVIPAIAAAALAVTPGDLITQATEKSEEEEVSTQ